MNLRTRARSIRWRIVLTYFIVVFIAMTIAGAFIIHQMENYQVDSVRTNSKKMVEIIKLSIPFDQYDSLAENEKTVQDIISEWKTGNEYEVYVLDPDFTIVASDNTSSVGSAAIGTIDDKIIVQALEGRDAHSQGTVGGDIPVLNVASPIYGENGSVIGAICLRANLEDIMKTLSGTRIIFMKAMLIALAVSVLLSVLLTGSITRPINDLRKKAEKMAEGDFSQGIESRSDDEIGQLAEMFNMMRRELKQRIDEMISEKSKLETILRYMDDGLIATDLEGRLIHVNAAARDLLEISEEESESLDFTKVLNRLGKQGIADGAPKKDDAGEFISETVVYHDKMLFVRYAAFVDEEEHDVGVIMLIQDITERHQLEQMQKDFVANVSHELRTPITTIKSYTETLIEGAADDPDTRTTFLKVIDDEADRMKHLVNDLLMLSRLDNRREKIALQITDLNTLLRSCIRKVELSAAAKKQEIMMDLNEGRPLMVKLDRDRMQQVFLNVLTNSIKYTREGGWIRIRSDIDRNVARVRISDNGIGISPDEVDRVFERFYRVDKARSRKEGGTGLGLSIAKNIVEIHNGLILADSVEGVGTTFTILLPFDASTMRVEKKHP